MKRLLTIFVLALLLNAVWENIHSVLYSNYMGGPITETILLRASLFDALLIALICAPFLYVHTLKDRDWLILIFGTLIGILNEWYGLSTGRWAYNSMMPILPLIKVGLSPTLQLGLLGYVSYKVEALTRSHFD
jgi:hypothetical protein